MADNLIPIEGFRFSDLCNDMPWTQFDIDLMGGKYPEVNSLVGDSDSRPLDGPPATSCAVDAETPGHSNMTNGGVERRRPGGNEALDMNDQIVLNHYSSLVVFANNPSATHLDIEHCDSSKQAIIQALAAKLDLRYSYNDPLGTIRLRKDSAGEDLERYSQQPRTTQRQATVHRSPLLTSTSHCEPTEAPLRDFFDTDGWISFPRDDIAMDIDALSPHFGNATLQYRGLSGDEQDMSHISPRPAPSLLRQSSRIGLSLTLKEIGACWRCKILRKKCDPEQLCRTCPRSGANNSKWQAIGCKRGTLSDHMPCLSLCPKSGISSRIKEDPTFNATHRELMDPKESQVERCLRDASNRLDDLFASERYTYTKIVLEILCSPMAVMTGIRLSLRSDVEANAIHIAWGLVDIASAKDILLVQSKEHIFDVIKAAVAYEMESCLSQIVPLAIMCFRNCIEIIRLYDGGHISTKIHGSCLPSACHVRPFQELSSNIKNFIDELSRTIFRKESRLQEKRWWLSVFYSLWIQSFVRRTIRFVENQPEVQLSPETKNVCSNYLLLALELFDAASTSFDPLMLTWSLEEEPPNIDIRLIKYYRLAQKALRSEQWAHDTGSSIDYLRRLYHDKDVTLIAIPKGDVLPPPLSNPGNDDGEVHGTFTTKPPIFHSHKSTQSHGRISVPLRIRSGAKRRAGSPLQDTSFIRRNGSSSSMLDSRDMRSRGLSGAGPDSPAYSYAYGTSGSTMWNGSTDGLAELANLYGITPPHSQDQYDYRSPSTGQRPSLHHKSSSESFLEIPRTLNKRRPTSFAAAAKEDLPGFFLCECCPKKPKKFDTVEGLSAHEAERKYQCNFCGTRFKSKNEAERHENSLHVRRHFWSCSNIPGDCFTNLFQESINQPGIADTCGYCGKDFPRSGEDICKQANKKDWAERLDHVRTVHKFGECNSAKRFYRADHFRQHLKHSHAATLGRWVNALESACVVDFPEP